MSDQPEEQHPEDPRDRFKRLLSSPEEDDTIGNLELGETEAELLSNLDGRLDESEDDKTRPIPEPADSETGGVISDQDYTDDVTPVARLEDEYTTTGEHYDFLSPPALDDDDMPLPKRVNEIDMDATRVAPVAYQPTPTRPRGDSTKFEQIQEKPDPVRSRVRNASKPEKKSKSWRLPRLPIQTSMGCFLRMGILGLFGFIIIMIVVGTVVLFEYYSVAATIPNVEDLQARASQFETTRILDRNGNTLYEILDPNAGRRTYVSINRISPFLVAATIATEDQNFYSHPGFDPMAILRAFYQNWRNEGETVSGASTITQQVARNLLFSPEERVEQTYRRKVREALAAAEITRRYTKAEILELYLNENFYGNFSYGVQAASEIYFNTTSEHLTIGQAAFLAGLPQAPSVYDIYNNRDATLVRLQQVLTLMYKTSQDQNCIAVSNNPQPICFDREAALDAYAEIQNTTFSQARVDIRYPHWVNYIRSELESIYDSQTIYRSGFSVYTTIDPGLQEDAQKIVQEQVTKLVDKNASNGALIAIRPATGEILAMVGSVDFYNESISGQVNMVTSPTRQPGSTIKPVTYLAAFEKGWTPSTLIWDVKTDFPPSGDPLDPRPPYQPVNYSGRFQGPVLLRSALANSYNIPAVKALQYVGIYDQPDTPEEDGMIAMARRLGITTLTRPDYGLALTLGGGEVSLIEMAGAYAVIANGGLKKTPVSILKILDKNGDVVFEHQDPVGDQVIHAEHAYLISSILSDNNARTPAFGPNSILAVSFPAAVKTGTTNDFRDNWTIGYTPDIVVGVWVGNSDYTPMQNTTGLTGAAPIWAEFIESSIQKITGGNPSPFVRPAGVVDRVICAVSGTEPSQWCPTQRGEIFASDQLPPPKEKDLWVKGQFDTWTGLFASDDCNEYKEEGFALNVLDPWGVKWIVETSEGQKWAEGIGFKQPIQFAPPRACQGTDPRPLLTFASPNEGQVVLESPLEINARVDASADFKRFELSYGLGNEPVEWELLHSSDQPVKAQENIYEWDLFDEFEDGFPSGSIVLRLWMESTRNTFAEKTVSINLSVPTFTPTPSPTVTPTFTPTETFVPTETPSPSPSPTNSPVPTPTATPTITSTVTQTPVATLTATGTQNP